MRLPERLTEYRDMPAPRFWEFEDAALDLGALRPGATDLAQILFIETVGGFGNDWYVVVEEPGQPLTQVGPISISLQEQKS